MKPLKSLTKFKKILIVDDEPYNLLGLKIMLQQAIKGSFKAMDLKAEGDVDSEGQTLTRETSDIHKATNGQEAVDAVVEAFQNGTYTYGVIFMDCSMPVMDGFEASDKIKNFFRLKKLPQPMIVAVTGHAEEEYIKKAWRYQMDELIPKPVNVEVLKDLL